MRQRKPMNRGERHRGERERERERERDRERNRVRELGKESQGFRAWL